jgi:foldase protein PrsA
MEEKKEVAKKKENKKQSSLIPVLVAGFVGAVLLASIVFYFVVGAQVKKLSEAPVILAASSIFRIPVATVNGMSVLYAEYVEDKNTLDKFYESAPEGFPPVSGDDTSDMALSRLIATKLVLQLTKEFDVKVTKEDIIAKKAELVANFPSEEDAISEIQNTYGWSLETYTKKVIVPILREEKLKEAFELGEKTEDDVAFQKEVKARHILLRVEEESEDATVLQLAKDLITRLQEGEDFAALAAEFGSDGTKEVGGDLGWFSRGMMVPEFEDAVYALEPGELDAEPVKTMFGYHIVQVDEVREVRDFVAYMDKKFDAAEIKVLLPINNPFEPVEPIAEGIDLGAIEAELGEEVVVVE